MDLILWRHAEAEAGTPDLSRALTKKGDKQAAMMARWLKPYLPKDAKILVSPARRTEQTAQALDMPYEIREELAPGTNAKKILRVSGWPDVKYTVVIVGHNPSLGQLAALLMSGDIADWNIRKGAAWWLTNRQRDGGNQVVLQAAMSPDLLIKEKH
jgi:phosphohistidine phosphatase